MERDYDKVYLVKFDYGFEDDMKAVLCFGITKYEAAVDFFEMRRSFDRWTCSSSLMPLGVADPYWEMELDPDAFVYLGKEGLVHAEFLHGKSLEMMEGIK
jgi:hypothetical protein